MTDATVDEEIEEKKPSKLPMIIGLVLALAGGGGGFFAVQSGMLGGGSEHVEPAAAPEEIATAPLPDVSFVEVPQVTITLSAGSSIGHLRFRGSLEVPAEYVQDVTNILPRVQDVMNSYLRALDPSDFEKSSALVRIRAQLLRRIKLVAGEGRVRDLLILEFILN